MIEGVDDDDDYQQKSYTKEFNTPVGTKGLPALNTQNKSSLNVFDQSRNEKARMANNTT